MSSASMRGVTTGRRTRTADVRQALVDAATTVLERDGVAGLTVRAVAAEAGVAPMGVYNHLDGKSGLLVVVLQRGYDALRDAVRPAASLAGIDRLYASGRGYRRFALANPVTYALMFSTIDKTPVDVEAITAHGAPAFQVLVDTVAETQRAGLLREGEVYEMALQIWSAVHGAVSLELTQNLTMHDEDVAAAKAVADRVYEGVLTMIVRGLAP